MASFGHLRIGKIEGGAAIFPAPRFFQKMCLRSDTEAQKKSLQPMPMPTRQNRISETRLQTFVIDLPETDPLHVAAYTLIGAFFVALSALAVYVMMTSPQPGMGS